MMKWTVCVLKCVVTIVVGTTATMVVQAQACASTTIRRVMSMHLKIWKTKTWKCADVETQEVSLCDNHRGWVRYSTFPTLIINSKKR